MPPDVALTFTDVSLRLESVEHGTACVIKDLSFSVKPNQFACLMGPSGCGKTTTLNLAAGFHSPSGGSLVWSDRKHSPAMVFQDDAVFAWMTVRENLAYAQKCAGFGTYQELKSLLELSGLTGSENFYPRELSGGMKKRVEFCRAWLSGRDLLLDEPLGQLDALTRKKQQCLLQELWCARPRTVVMVTHDIAEAAFLADVIFIMAGPPGQIVKQISVPFDRPRDQELRFTDSFIQFLRTLELSLDGGI
jgi:NitT/TauT family transport system ATP-binding protein